MIRIIGAGKVQVSRNGVYQFNRGWPCSELRSTRSYWFEFDKFGDLVDTDLPKHDDGAAASAMAADAKAYLFNNVLPKWARQ